MPRIALQLSENFVAAVCKMMSLEEDPQMFGDSTYAVVTTVSPTEFNFKLVNEDEIFELAKVDADLTILSL